VIGRASDSDTSAFVGYVARAKVQLELCLNLVQACEWDPGRVCASQMYSCGDRGVVCGGR
jgi:hypothetical protein